MKRKKVTSKSLAARLNGCEYGLETTGSTIKDAQESGLVIVYGYSDDNMEFDGAIHDEVGCWDGGKAFVSKSRKVYAAGGSVPEGAKRNVIEALWCAPGSDAAWTYKTDIPHETFNVYEDGELFCVGIVFSLEDLK